MSRNPSDHLCTVVSGQLADVLPSGVSPWQDYGEEDLGLSTLVAVLPLQVCNDALRHRKTRHASHDARDKRKSLAILGLCPKRSICRAD